MKGDLDLGSKNVRIKMYQYVYLSVKINFETPGTVLKSQVWPVTACTTRTTKTVKELKKEPC